MDNIYARDIEYLKKSLLVTFKHSAESKTLPLIDIIRGLNGVESAEFQRSLSESNNLALTPVFCSCVVLAEDESSIAILKCNIEKIPGVKSAEARW